MRASELFARTLRDAPAEADAPSHKLLVRGAYIRKVMAGVYTMLPLGLRTLHKIEQIVREEMDASGAQEIRMPAILPAEPWKQSGRWEKYGELMFRLKDRTGREMSLGPTHEEFFTLLVQGEFSSYRDLPVNLYQIQWKYRDELRARSGLLRGREFLMKDAYTFDRDQEALDVAYGKMVVAYRKAFDRCGLTYRQVEADPGVMADPDSVNHEFMAPADVGEDLFVYCANCDYGANVEAATTAPPAEGGVEEPLTEVHTPNRPGIADVVEQLGRPAAEMLKCMLYDVAGETVAVLVPGDREISETKLARALLPRQGRLLEEDEFPARGFVKGYVGPQGLSDDVEVIADDQVRARRSWITGANKRDYHVTGATLDRDFHVTRWADVSVVLAGDPCPRCGNPLAIGRAIEVGHCFQLRTTYSSALKAVFLDEDGTERPYHMGSYGIGITRIIAAVAEQHHDDAGLKWPKAVAPFHAVVIPTNMDQASVVDTAERIYNRLREGNVEAVIDDRSATAGVKFADADLIGYPVQMVVGKRGLESGTVDLKVRATGVRTNVAVPDASAAVESALADAP